MLNLFQHPGGAYENITSRHSELDSESRSLVDVSNELTSSPFRKRSSSYNLHLGTCNRSFLRTEKRLTINQFLLFFRISLVLSNPLPATTDHGLQEPRSRIKSGMTVLGNYEYVTFHHAESVAVLDPSSSIMDPSFERAAARLRARTR
ncbi:hypothetical protein V513_02240 [Mesotoga sp. H07.pep.5.3]|nr:hypothetical protein V513_02240 [Mesotoga sp. H07.pep.5.3]